MGCWGTSVRAWDGCVVWQGLTVGYRGGHDRAEPIHGPRVSPCVPGPLRRFYSARATATNLPDCRVKYSLLAKEEGKGLSVGASEGVKEDAVTIKMSQHKAQQG